MNGATAQGDQAGHLDDLEREALAWLVHLRSGRATSDDAEALTRWRAESRAHEQAFRNAVALERGFRTMLGPAAEKLRLDGSVTPLRPKAPRLSRRVFLAGGAMAASGAGAVLLADPPLDLWPSWAEWTAPYRTGTGQRRTITPLAGVTVDMNTRTSFRRAFGDSGLSLVSGEAYVSVDRPEPVPLAVAGCTLTARHARFVVRRVGDTPGVACIAGELFVARGESSVRLGAERQLDLAGKTLGQPVAADTAQWLGWRSGRLVFVRQPLSEVVTALNRYRTGQIIIADSALGREKISAVFYLDQIDKARNQIEGLVGRRGVALPGGTVIIG